MASSVERVVKILDHQDAPIILPRPKSVAVHMGRTFVLIIETSKRTLAIFANSMQQLGQFLETLPEKFVITGRRLFVQRSRPVVLQPLLPAAPKWNFRVQEPRRCKSRETKPLLSLTDRQVKQLKAHTLTKPPKAIPNGANCCFMAAVLIAFSVSPKLRSRIESSQLNNRPVVEGLRHVYSIIDSKKSSKKRDLTACEIEKFRKTCINAGFIHSSNTSQEDASAFSQFLLRELGCEDVALEEVNEHHFPIPVDLTKSLEENHLVLQVGDSEESDIQHLIHKRRSSVELVRDTALQYLIDEDDLSEEHLETLEKMKAVETIPVEQTVRFSTTSLPPVLPIFLERGNYDSATKSYSINQKKFVPNASIEIPQASGDVAHYDLVTAVTRDQYGTALNQDSGHYASYIRYEHKGEPLFVRYDSGKITVHDKSALDKIAEEARFLLYEFRYITKA